MDNHIYITRYLQLGKAILLTSNQMLNTVEEIQSAIFNYDYQQLETLNQRILAHSKRMEQIDEARRKVALELGCSGDNYSKQIREKFSGKTAQLIVLVDDKVKESIMDCRDKLNQQGGLMTLQHDVISEALASNRLKLNV
ncbi:flagellar export chaperone FlgN [Vibrio astriarenae]